MSLGVSFRVFLRLFVSFRVFSCLFVCLFVSFRVFSCLFASFRVFSCLFVSFRVFSSFSMTPEKMCRLCKALFLININTSVKLRVAILLFFRLRVRSKTACNIYIPLQYRRNIVLTKSLRIRKYFPSKISL